MVDPSELDPDGISRREFTTAFRGFDQVEVRAFLSSVSIRLREVFDREAELVRRLEQTEQRATEVDQLDESRLTSLLGEETARIFEAAREAAAEIRGKAEAKTAQMVRDAQDEASKLTKEASEILRLRTSEAETAAASIVSEAEIQRDRMLADARTEAEAMRVDATADAERLRGEAQQARDQAEIDAAAAVEQGRVEGRDMVAEAQVVRERILKDLARRRRSGKAQLEQLRAARERLLDAYALVRRTLDEATTELTVAVPEAKLAADAAGRRVEYDDDELSVEAIEAELDAGRVAGMSLLDTGEVPVARPAPDAELAVEPQPEPVPEPAPVVDEVEPDETAVASEVEQVEIANALVVEVEVEPVAAAGQAGDEGDEGDDEEGGRVDDLFARLRSEVPEPDDVADDETGDDEAGGGAAIEVENPADEDDDADETVLERRDRYLADLEADLARVLKRQMADDENDKLDVIRRRPAKGSPADLMPPLDEHRAAFLEAISDTLVLAAASGSEFAAGLLDPDGSTADAIIDLDVDLDDLATELVDSLLVPIRDRVPELVGEADGDDALDAVRACYRQAKGSIGDLAAQYAHTAFNRGVFDAVPDGTMVRWVVDPGAGPCPDGEDDALEGPIAKGTPFPTGHLHPPAHPGCRCLLVPGVL